MEYSPRVLACGAARGYDGLSRRVGPAAKSAMLTFLNRLYPVRYTAFALCVLGLLLALAYFAVSGEGGWAVVVFALLVALGVTICARTATRSCAIIR